MSDDKTPLDLRKLRQQISQRAGNDAEFTQLYAAFYRSLISRGIPDDLAGMMTVNYHQWHMAQQARDDMRGRQFE